MRQLLLQRNYFLFWLSGLVSMIGEWALYIAMPFYIYSQTHSTLASGYFLISQLFPKIAFGWLMGTFIDRLSGKSILLGATFIQSLIFALFLYVDSFNQFYILYLCAMATSITSQLIQVSRSALLPHLIDQEDLVTANSLNCLTINFNQILASIIGGFLLSLYNLEAVIGFAITSMVIAVLLASPIKTIQARVIQREAPSQGTYYSMKTFWQSWSEGKSLLINDPLLRRLFIAGGMNQISSAVVQALLAAYVESSLRAPSHVYGWLMAFQGLGGVIGSIGTSKWAFKHPQESLQILFARTTSLSGLFLLCLILSQNYYLNFLFMGLFGISIVVFVISGSTLIQTRIEKKFLGRLLGLYSTSQSLFFLIGLSLASIGGEKIGILPMISLGAMLAIATGMVFQYSSKALKN